MFINNGDIVSIGYYPKSSFFKSVVCNVYHEMIYDIVSVKITKECRKIDFFEDDPAVLGIQMDNKVYLTNCHIYKVDPQNEFISFSVNIDEFIVNTRAYERYPLSLYANVILKDTKEEGIVIIKNISANGLMICTKKEFKEDQALDISFHAGDQKINMLCKVIWEAHRGNILEYGLKSTFMDYHNQNLLHSFITNLKNEQEEFIKSLKSSME